GERCQAEHIVEALPVDVGIAGRGDGIGELVGHRTASSDIGKRLGERRTTAEVADTLGDKQERRVFEVLQRLFLLVAVVIDAVAGAQGKGVGAGLADKFRGAGGWRPRNADARAEAVVVRSGAASTVATLVARPGKSRRRTGEDLRFGVGIRPAVDAYSAKLGVLGGRFHIPAQAVV